MNYTVVIKPFAEDDIYESYAWYQNMKDGLGDVFLDKLETSFLVLEISPDQYQVRYKQVRMVKLNQFPICIHYTIEAWSVYVHAVLSTDRDPLIWKSRSK